MPLSIRLAARSSTLSRMQTEEVIKLFPSIQFECIWVETWGDQDLATSLRSLEKTNFFTREIDHLLLTNECRIAVHSAKDLPEPLPQGLILVALTEGVDARDSLVFNREIPLGGTVGTSCERREQAIKNWRPDVQCIDVRGTIEKRLSLLDAGQLDGLVIAEAAIIRLGLQQRNRIFLKGKTATLQGKLAVVAREDDREIWELFKPLDIRRKKILYLGLDPVSVTEWGEMTHVPLICIKPLPQKKIQINKFTHLIFTSKTTVELFEEKIGDQMIIAIGEVTATHLRNKGVTVHLVAEECTQEGIIALLDTLSLEGSHILLPCSAIARPNLADYLRKREIKHQVYQLYTSLPSRLPLPSLEQFDEIVFTSPSVVRAFEERALVIPKTVKVRAIGPVTSNALRHIMSAQGDL